MEAKCKKCEEFFPASVIMATVEGFYCQDCIPVDNKKEFITLRMSWIGINALLDYIEGTATVDQLMVIDKMTEAIRRKMMKLLQEMIKNGGEVQESDPKPMGTGDD